MSLQTIGHRDSKYERPNQKWVCGWAADGRACPVGPGKGGRCTAEAQGRCSPRKEGDRWVCTRLSVFGDACEPGPLPDGSCCRPKPTHAVCQPRLSLRARRGRLVAGTLAMTVGLLVIALTVPGSIHFISPGDLASAHANVEDLEGSGVECAACHGAGGDSVARWVAAGFGAGTETHDSENCLRCHFNGSEEERANAMFVHGEQPARLELKTQRAQERPAQALPALQSLAAMSGPPPVSSSGTIACSVCHKEHRGRQHSLTAMDNQRCQSCHAVKFGSISDGHPDFAWADREASWTNFNHVDHKELFEGGFDCARCHVNAADGNMTLEPFERSCAGCHIQGKTDHHGDRIRGNQGIMLQLPYMELDSDVYWPDDAAVGLELTPLTRLLLSGDPEAQEALENLSDPDYADTLWVPEEWYPDDEALKDDLALAIKRLIADLADADRSTVIDRLTEATGLPSDNLSVITLADQLRSASLAALEFQRFWLIEKGDDAPWLGEGLDVTDNASGWVVNTDEPAVEYRPLGHGDRFLEAWTNVLVEASRGSDSPENPTHDLLKQATTGGFLYTTCVRCHVSRPDGTDGVSRIDWQGAAQSPGLFTKFDHTPHLRAAGELQCNRCHQFAEGENAELPTGPRADMVPLQKTTCVGCHNPGGAPQDCLTCHDYHAHGI